MESLHQGDAVVCGECETAPPTWDCKDCGEHYCDSCKDLVHSKGQRKKHTNFEKVVTCQECSAFLAVRKCEDCKGKVYCEQCFMSTHNRNHGKYRRHNDFDIFGVKQKPFVDPDVTNGFGIEVSKLICNEERFAHWQSDIKSIMGEAGEAGKRQTEEGDAQHFTDVQILRMEGSVTRRRTRGWRRLNKLLVDDVYNETQPSGGAAASLSSPRASVLSAASMLSSTRSRSSVFPANALIGIDQLVNSKWHKERKSHYLFEIPNNTFLVSSRVSGVAHPHHFDGVTALSKFLDYDQFGEGDDSLKEDDGESAAADGDIVGEGATEPAVQDEGTSPLLLSQTGGASNINATAAPATAGRAFEVATALLAMNGSALANTIVSAEYYREHGVLFTQLYDTRANQWRMLYVDDLFPCDTYGSLLFGLTEHTAETWKMFLVKSAAKFFGSVRTVEQSKDLVTMLKAVTGGTVTVDVWKTSRGDLRGPQSEAQDRTLLKQYLWWLLGKANAHRCMLLVASTTEATVEAAHSAAVGEVPVASEEIVVVAGEEEKQENPLASPIIAPCALREALPDEVLPYSILRAKAKVLKKQQEVFYNTALPDANSSTELSPARRGEQTEEMNEMRKADGAPNPVFDLANCGCPLFGAELTSRDANKMGMRRESFVGDHALGLRLCKLRQFTNWVQQSPALDATITDGRGSIATSTMMAGQRFRYHNASRLWTKPLREYFGMLSAGDEDLTHSTMEDLRSLFNSTVLVSDVTNGSRMLPVSLFPTQRQPVDVGPTTSFAVVERGTEVATIEGAAIAQSKVEGSMVKALVKLTPEAMSAVAAGESGAAAGVNFLSAEAFDLLVGTEVANCLDHVDIHLLVPQTGIELGSLRRSDAYSTYVSDTAFTRVEVLEPTTEGEDGAPKKNEWLQVSGGGLPAAPILTCSPARVRMAPQATPPRDGSTEEQDQVDAEEIHCAPGEKEDPEEVKVDDKKKKTKVTWLVMTVQAKYPRASLKVLLNFNKELVAKVILLEK